MYCANCGEKIEDGDLFCPVCGARTEESTEKAFVTETTPTKENIRPEEKQSAGTRTDTAQPAAKKIAAQQVPGDQQADGKPERKNERKGKAGGGKKQSYFIVAIIAAFAVLLGIGIFVYLHFFTYRSVKIESISGEAKLDRKGNDKEIFEGMKLIPEDEVTTGDDGTVELIIDTDKHMVAAENTCFSVNAVGNANSGKVTIKLEYGSTLATIDEKLAENSEFEIETPNCTCSVRGTIFRVTYDPATNTTIVEVIEGVVRIKTKSGKEDLNAGESAVITDDVITVGAGNTTGVTEGEGGNIDGSGDGNGEDGEDDGARFTSLEEAKEAIDAVGWGGAQLRDPSDRVDVLPFVTEEGYVVFGACEQDDYAGNGPEPIEWEVLGSDENGTLLVSRYVMRGANSDSYEPDDRDTWETSITREWLNGAYYDTTFTAAEKGFIREAHLSNPDNPFTGHDGGGDTTDFVFLLSLEDLAENYQLNYENDEYGQWYGQELIAAPVAGSYLYAETFTEETYQVWGILVGYDHSCVGLNGSSWMLRSAGRDGYSFCAVGAYGETGPGVCIGDYRMMGVRPAIYISEEFSRTPRITEDPRSSEEPVGKWDYSNGIVSFELYGDGTGEITYQIDQQFTDQMRSYPRDMGEYASAWGDLQEVKTVALSYAFADSILTIHPEGMPEMIFKREGDSLRMTGGCFMGSFSGNGERLLGVDLCGAGFGSGNWWDGGNEYLWYTADGRVYEIHDPWGPGGTLTVEASDDDFSAEGFHFTVISYAGWEQPVGTEYDNVFPAVFLMDEN